MVANVLHMLPVLMLCWMLLAHRASRLAISLCSTFCSFCRETRQLSNIELKSFPLPYVYL